MFGIAYQDNRAIAIRTFREIMAQCGHFHASTSFAEASLPPFDRGWAECGQPASPHLHSDRSVMISLMNSIDLSMLRAAARRLRITSLYW
jgi:hypothetical protein